MSGTLFLCGTPIGNLSDISFRVLETLKSCSLIAAEDTRQTRKILTHFDIKTPLTSYHEHNKKTKGPVLVEKLLSGDDIALVTDAGLPGISDPGADMVKECIEDNIPVTLIPGPSACLMGLILSGMDTRRFVFEGFLPREKKERRKILERLKNEDRTIILYEAPHRLTETLSILLEALGDRSASCAKELTKIHETVRRDTLSALFAFYSDNPPKGEFVIVLSGKSEEEIETDEKAKWENLSPKEHVEKYMSEGLDQKDAIKQTAKIRGVSKREIYSIIHKKEE